MLTNVGDPIDGTRTALRKALQENVRDMRKERPERVTRQVISSALHPIAPGREARKSKGIGQHRRGVLASDLLKGARDSTQGS